MDTGAYRTPAWHELVIYELHVGTFSIGLGPYTAIILSQDA